MRLVYLKCHLPIQYVLHLSWVNNREKNTNFDFRNTNQIHPGIFLPKSTAEFHQPTDFTSVSAGVDLPLGAPYSILVSYISGRKVFLFFFTTLPKTAL